MKRTFTSIVTCLFVLAVLSTNVSFAEEKVNWETFGKNLVSALQAPNTGLQVSAMQEVIKHAENVNVDKAGLDLIKLYRRHKDENVRQMALVTINSVNNEWAMEIVKRDFEFEKSKNIKRMMAAIIKEGQSKKTS
jgi:hypothetical protein